MQPTGHVGGSWSPMPLTKLGMHAGSNACTIFKVCLLCNARLAALDAVYDFAYQPERSGHLQSEDPNQD